MSAIYNFSNSFKRFVRSYRHTQYNTTIPNGYIRQVKIIINIVIELFQNMRTDKTIQDPGVYSEGGSKVQ